METSIRIGDTIYSVGSDKELEMMEEALVRLTRDRAIQKQEREKAAIEIMESVANFVENYGMIIIGNSTADIYVDAENIAGFTCGYRGEDD